MNKKGEFSFTNWMIALAFMALIMIVIGNSIGMLNNTYGQDNFDDTELSAYNETLSQLSNIVLEANGSVQQSLEQGVDTGVFDFLGQLFSNALVPLKVLFTTTELGLDVSNNFIDDLGIFPVFKTYIAFLILAFIIVGFFIFKVLLKIRDQN